MKGQSVTIYLELIPLISLFLLGYAQSGLYPGLGLGPVETLRRQSFVSAFGYVVLAAFTFALKLPHLYSRATFIIALGLSLIVVPLTRAALTRAATRWRWWNEPVVIVGTGERAVRAVRNIQRGHFGYVPVGVFAMHPAIGSHVEGVPIVGDLARAADLAARGIRVALIGGGNVRPHARRSIAAPFSTRRAPPRIRRPAG